MVREDVVPVGFGRLVARVERLERENVVLRDAVSEMQFVMDEAVIVLGLDSQYLAG